jgi:hypothetical protein
MVIMVMAMVMAMVICIDMVQAMDTIDTFMEARKRPLFRL